MVGQGVEAMTEDGFSTDCQRINVELFVFSTGNETFRAGTPASRARISVNGCDRVTPDEKWTETEVSTLYGIFSPGSPNFIIPRESQTALAINIVHAMDVMTADVAHVVAEARKIIIHGETPTRIIIEPTADAEDTWSLAVAERAIIPSPVANRTLSYSNAEGKAGEPLSSEDKLKLARGWGWANGILDFQDILEAWRAEGSLRGILIKAAA